MIKHKLLYCYFTICDTLSIAVTTIRIVIVIMILMFCSIIVYTASWSKYIIPYCVESDSYVFGTEYNNKIDESNAYIMYLRNIESMCEAITYNYINGIDYSDYLVESITKFKTNPTIPAGKLNSLMLAINNKYKHEISLSQIKGAILLKEYLNKPSINILVTLQGFILGFKHYSIELYYSMLVVVSITVISIIYLLLSLLFIKDSRVVGEYDTDNYGY